MKSSENSSSKNISSSSAVIPSIPSEYDELLSSVDPDEASGIGVSVGSETSVGEATGIGVSVGSPVHGHLHLQV